MLLHSHGSTVGSAQRHFFLTLLLICLNFSSIKACTSGSIRLVGGADDLEGTVEVCRNGAYGTVCDDSWDTRDAMVVCRQLGYTSGTAYTNAHFGPGTGRIVMTYVYCTGSESTLTSCPHTINRYCSHSEDAGVSCEGGSGSGELVGAIVGGVIGGIAFLIYSSRARQAAPVVQMTSIPAQTINTIIGAYTQSEPKAENRPPPPSYSDYMEQQTQPAAPMAYPGYAAPAVGFTVQGYPQQDYPSKQQQEAPVGYPQQEPQGYGGTNPGTDESTGIRDESPPPY
uniref:SRCR domain-containing protein n=1 Tax=Amphimedon queenslandica TaxID=400682 RepID=A0A1X7T991_AMPQE